MRDELPDNIRQWYHDWFLIDRFYTRWAKRYDLTYASLFTLYVLHGHHGCTPTYIAEFLSLSKQTVASTLRRMEEKGLVRHEESKRDRRSQIVILTEKGKAFADGVMTDLYAMEQRAFARLTDGEIREMVRINRQLASAIQAELEEDEDASER